MSDTTVTISRLRQLLRDGHFAVSTHASQELRKDGLGISDAVQAIVGGEIAEDDRERQCCIVSGMTTHGFALHVVVDYRRGDRPIFVTAYIPQSEDWVLPRALRRR